jgi:hypothetical protein
MSETPETDDWIEPDGLRFVDAESLDAVIRQRDEAVRILQNVDLMIDELLSPDGYVSQKTMIEVGEDIGSFLATLDRTEKT